MAAPSTREPKPVNELVRDLCRSLPGSVGLPESTDPRVLAAADILLRDGTMEKVWLFSDRESSLQEAQKLGIDLGKHSGLQWAKTEYSDMAERTAASLRTQYEARGKTISDSALTAQSATALSQAGELLYEGVVDAVIAGTVATTGEVIRAAISSVGLARGTRTVSGSFIMDRAVSGSLDGHTYIYADCGVVIEPTVEQLCDIAWESVRTWQGVLADRGEPVVAFLSFSTKGSASHGSQEKIAQAAALFKDRHPEIKSDGEMQFDAAFSREVGTKKSPGSPVPGAANIFVFPDLNSGNISYKITQRLAGFSAYGPILQGLAKPFSDLSRGASVDDIVTSAHINLLRSRLPAAVTSKALRQQ